MKVAILNDQLNAGGAERVVVNTANMLHNIGVDVMVVLFLQPAALDNLLHCEIPVHYLRRKGRLDIKAMSLLKQLVGEVDIVHVHSRYNLRYFMLAKYVTRIFHPSIVFHEHAPILSIDYFTKLIIQKSNAYVAVIRSMCEWAKQDLHLDANKVHHLRNVVLQLDLTFGEKEVGTKMIMVGNFWSFKNQAFALQLLKALDNSFTLDIYGMINDQNYYDQLMNAVVEYNLKDRVKFITGVNDIYSVLSNYNFAIHTSTQETGPLVLLEYMQAKLPFLTFATGDVADTISNDLPELIIKSFNVNEWINRIETVMMIEESRKDIEERMEAVQNKHFSQEAYIENLTGIYKSVSGLKIKMKEVKEVV